MAGTRDTIDRRTFVQKGLRASAATAAASLAMRHASLAAPRKRKLAMVGTGSRGSGTWGRTLLEHHGEYVDIVGLCDVNSKRVAYAKKYIGVDVPVYAARDFEAMIQETQPDAVIVTTTDCFHAEYVVRALELGCDAICEKPLVTEAAQARDILEAETRTGRKVITTFNARYGQASEGIKKVLLSGELGRILSAEFQEYLDIDHGASYFRRWHGKMRFSGSLLVHKASHHFDQMNWWLDAEPEEVHAFGDVAFYGHNNSFRSRTCRGCPFAEKCAFHWDITQSQRYMDLYVACEDEDGYRRDGCVWDNDIDTYDRMTVEVKYNNGVLLSYSLNAFMPYEGQQIAFNGEHGRLDVRVYQRQPWDVEADGEFRLTKSFKTSRTWTTKRGAGEHGGSDRRMKDLMFRPDQPDPLNSRAGSRAGVMSSLIGIAARRSIETGARVRISDLLELPVTWKW
jgi:predicted dehydrogenase